MPSAQTFRLRSDLSHPVPVVPSHPHPPLRTPHRRRHCLLRTSPFRFCPDQPTFAVLSRSYLQPIFPMFLEVLTPLDLQLVSESSALTRSESGPVPAFLLARPISCTTQRFRLQSPFHCSAAMVFAAHNSSLRDLH